MARPRKYVSASDSVVSDEFQNIPEDGVENMSAPAVNASATAPAERFYPGQKDIVSDLFQLEDAYMLKDVGFNEKLPEYVKVIHSHFFRTFDSSGKKGTTSQVVGGHFHPIQETQNPDGSITITALPAKKWAQRRNGTKVMVDVKDDHHSHRVEYMRSHQVKAREINKEFVKFQSTLTAPAAVEGVIERS